MSLGIIAWLSSDVVAKRVERGLDLRCWLFLYIDDEGNLPGLLVEESKSDVEVDGTNP